MQYIDMSLLRVINTIDENNTFDESFIKNYNKSSDKK